MKKHFSIIIVFAIAPTFFGCDNSKNVSKEEICNKSFKEDKFISNIGMTVTRTTVLKCDGTFESGVSYTQITEGELGSSDNLSGTWQIEETIPENVKNAVIEYGLKNDNYSIIKYSSSNSISGYCLYYKIESNYLLTPLYLNQIPMSRYDDAGSLGIWGGFLE